ncbi:hypothetical protein A2118_00730 [Candidatus Kaiserbacteria bacterium GWA2_50_9]|uniref:Uncharacterized protein n=1 Tax=Candidatus Kaiserbacteria bacterium GWA2_50_9 TaxID=1798474 RepID=A0A1F6BSH9_9BACT|nr:MAG: hypothetical protein A2118_00730 [Candidatus Kaiserbacteria bacterium GWA2_50_9]
MQVSCNKNRIVARTPKNLRLAPATDLFLLKKSATHPRTVVLRPCEAPRIRFSPFTRAPQAASPYFLMRRFAPPVLPSAKCLWI